MGGGNKGATTKVSRGQRRVWGGGAAVFARARRRETLSLSRARARKRGLLRCSAAQSRARIVGRLDASKLQNAWVGGGARGCRVRTSPDNVSLSLSGSEQGGKKKRAFLPLFARPRFFFWHSHPHAERVHERRGLHRDLHVDERGGGQSPLSRRTGADAAVSLLLSPLYFRARLSDSAGLV